MGLFSTLINKLAFNVAKANGVDPDEVVKNLSIDVKKEFEKNLDKVITDMINAGYKDKKYIHKEGENDEI